MTRAEVLSLLWELVGGTGVSLPRQDDCDFDPPLCVDYDELRRRLLAAIQEDSR
jgi:hypothetical protein